GVVLDGRDVVDRLAEAALFGVDQPGERAALGIYGGLYFRDVLEARERAAGACSINACQSGNSFELEVRQTAGEGGTGAKDATDQNSRPKPAPTRGVCQPAICGQLGHHGPRPEAPGIWAGAALEGRLRL